VGKGKNQIVQHVLKMQEVSLLPKYIKYGVQGPAVCISHIWDTRVFKVKTGHL